jgi:NACHT domain-containing protein
MSISAVALGAASEALGSLTYRVASSLYGTAVKMPKPKLSRDSFLIKAPDGTRLILDSEHVTAIASFLSSPEVAALVQTYVLSNNMSDSSEEPNQWSASAEDSFRTLFNYTLPHLNGSWQQIWHLIVRQFEFVAPSSRSFKRLSSKDRARILDSGAEILGERPPPQRYIREIIALTRNTEWISRIRTICVDVCHATRELTAQVRLDHTQDNHRFSYEDLYIDRTLRSQKGRSEVDPSRVMTDPAPGNNVVIIGAPGAGKSTLITRIANNIARRPNTDFAPIIMRCRELSNESDEDLIRQLLKWYQRLPGVDLSMEDLNALLSVGRAFVIFDGIDELVDLQRRRKFTSSIEALATTFPLSPFVCTTRKVGYESAEFQTPYFTVLELEEYSTEQVEEYAAKWFRLMGKPDADRRAFLLESEEIGELRSNPLMLSLLCTLYRVRGYIPMNRLDVYKSCADLLFYSWDALRHIPQPVDHRRYGHTLMEELADLFFKFPSTSGGIEERQLSNLIAGYFRDTAGVEAAESKQRAADFLEFCAGRAWLLTAIGHDSRGQRLFAFTHRTFMEFYAAVAVVRRANSEADILQMVIDVYKKNPSSVLPDIIVQAYDEKSHRGAETLLRALMREGREGRRLALDSHVPICLRILNSTPVGAPLVRDVLLNALRVMATPRQDCSRVAEERDRKLFVSLLQLYKDPRNVCWKILSGSDDSVNPEIAGHYKKAFITQWAQLWLLDEAQAYEDIWMDLVNQLCNDDDLLNAVSPDPVVNTYLVLNRKTDRVPTYSPSLFSIRCFGRDVPGLLLRAIVMIGRGQEDPFSAKLIEFFGKRVAREPMRVVDYVLGIAARMMDILLPAMRDLDSTTVTLTTAQRNTLLWVSCILSEGSPTGLHPFHDAVRYAFPNDLLFRIIRKRNDSSFRSEAQAEELSDVRIGRALRKEVLELFSKWVVEWMMGKRDLLIVTDRRTEHAL